MKGFVVTDVEQFLAPVFTGQVLKYALSPLYHGLFPAELLRLEIKETKATCDACAMTPEKEKGPVTYQADLKCCTFEPYLPNYLVGALLESSATSASAAQALRDKIARREYSLPIGATASVAYQVALNQRKPAEFGNRPDWLCPYYNRELNNCGIWKYRGAVCTTFFCKSDYGKKGLKFWDQLSDYLTYVEMALMEEALVQLDFSPRQISACLDYLNRKEGSTAELKTSSLSLSKSQQLWNGYFDEQEEFFRKTYHLVQDFDKKRFQEALGEQGLGLQEKLLKSARSLN